MFKTGLVSISFRQLSVDELIRYTKEAGLSAIEWGSDSHAPYDDMEKIEYIARAQKEAGLYCSSYGTYFTIGEHDTDELRGYIAAARVLGTNVLRLWCGTKNYSELTKEEREFIISESKKAAKIAEEEGVIFCMECHLNSFTHSLAGALDLMRSVNSESFRMYWQPGIYESQETNLAYARGIAPYTVNVHVNHFDMSVKQHPLEEGREIWEKYIACFDGSQHLLIEHIPDRNPEHLAIEAGTLNSIAKMFNK